MTQHTTFEVHVQQGGQWTIHETFRSHQIEASIEEAKDLLVQRPNINAVKVIKETLNPDSGIFNDTVIFKANAKKKSFRRKACPAKGWPPIRAAPTWLQAGKKPSPEKGTRKKKRSN